MDNYPTDEQLIKILEFDGAGGNLNDWFALIYMPWWMPDWGWTCEEDVEDDNGFGVTRYHLSTGGWSGNEAIIGAMQDNWLAWGRCWVQSRRGGHYIFEVPVDAQR